MRNFTIIVLISAIFPFIDCSSQKAAGPDFATISFFVGDVTINGSGSSLAIGDSLKEKDRITTGERSSCDIKIGSSIIRIKEKSKMVFSSLSIKESIENTSLDLEQGRLLCKPKKLLKSESFSIKTPTAVAAVRGTEFTVESDMAKTTRIKVFDGKVMIAKRAPSAEGSISSIAESGAPLEEKQSVIITQKEVDAVDQKIQKSMAMNKTADPASIVASFKSELTLSQKDIVIFNIQDFSRDESELIAVKEKEPEVIKKVKETIKKDLSKNEKPAPEGRLLITRYEIYFIKNGRVEWEGKIINPPVQENNLIYIASEDFVFCASPDGPVLWKKQMINDGKIELKESTATIFVKGKPVLMDAVSGKDKM